MRVFSNTPSPDHCNDFQTMKHFTYRYVESAQTLERETNLKLSRFEVCDNVNLETVLMEYEAYYHVKFNKYPKVTKKLVQNG